VSKAHLSIKEVGVELGVSPAHAHKLVTSGRLRAINVGDGAKAYWRIARVDLQQFIEDERQRTAQRFSAGGAA
jgi:excisionase family DNA binding protein